MQINRTALSKQTFALRAFAFAFALVSPFREWYFLVASLLGWVNGGRGFFTLRPALGWIDNNLARVYLGFN